MKSLLLVFLLIISSSAIAGTIKAVSIDDFNKYLLQKKEEKLLFFYTSWCTHCKSVTLAKDLPKNKIIFISVDSEQEAIDEFAKKMKYDTYYIEPTEEMQNLVKLSSKLGIKFMKVDKEGRVDGHLPYIVYLDSKNRVLADDIQIESIQKYLK